MNEIGQVFVVDDDDAVQDALVLLLETAGFSVQGFTSGAAFLSASSTCSRGCVVLDAHMPDMDGPTVYQALRARNQSLPVIFLTAYGTIPQSVQAIKSGAFDFLTKPVDGAHLINRVAAALDQNARQRERQATHSLLQQRLNNLTSREREVMALALRGLTNKQIARHLFISHRTVEIHRARVMHKTGASNLLELARMAEAWAAPPP